MKDSSKSPRIEDLGPAGLRSAAPGVTPAAMRVQRLQPGILRQRFSEDIGR